MPDEKQEIITFKVPESLKEAMRGIPNRSEFIRSAIIAALHDLCPLCRGAGILMPNQHRHWEEFSRAHSVEECDKCSAIHIVCRVGGGEQVHGKALG